MERTSGGEENKGLYDGEHEGGRGPQEGRHQWGRRAREVRNGKVGETMGVSVHGMGC